MIAMATSTSTSPKAGHFKSLFRNASPKSKSIGRAIKRRSSGKLKSTDKTGIHLESSSDSDNTVPLHSVIEGLSLAQTTPLSAAAQAGYRAVVAIDFGTTYSGYAYSFVSHPHDIHLMRTTQGGRYSGTRASTNKIPTILLLNEKGGFNSFGQDARDAYHDLDEEEAKKWLYFEKFKLELHTRKDLNTSMELESSNGQRVLATIVFGHALRFFKDCCIKELNDVSITQSSFSPDDIQWVVTVPAIWRQSAKQFMRHAAVQAGLLKAENWKQLIIALEPEAASIYCQTLYARECGLDTPLSSSGSATASSPSPSTGAPKYKSLAGDTLRSSVPEIDLSTTGSGHNGTRYIVADCGGGTVDVTVHELTQSHNLQELYKASGGTWGSMGVDCQFEQLLADIFGQKFIVEFVKSYPISWLELVNTFEVKKCSFCPSKQVSVSLPLPFSLIESFLTLTGKTVKAAIQECDREGVHWTSQGMLRLSPSAMMELFEPTINAIVQHIQEILLIPGISKIEYLFLVGGFAESALLQEAIQKAFRSFLRVVIPQNVSLTILKGAVMFGHDPTLVHVRRSLFTYGVACLNQFIPGKHPKELKITREKSDWCSGIFDAFVFADQAISLGHTVTRSYTVAEGSRQSTLINLYASEEETVQYINDPGCSKVGHLEFGFPYNIAKSPIPREIILSMVFGETEIRAKATDCISGQTASASFNFLTK